MNSITRRAFVQAGVAATLASGASLAGAERAQGQIAASPQIDFTGDGIPLSAAEYAQLLARLTTSATELDEYSRGGPVAALERQFATLLGKEAAVFMPSGTLANHLAVPPFPPAQAYISGSIKVWRIRAEATLPDGVTFVHEAVLRPSPDAMRPLIALAWLEPSRSAAAPPLASNTR